MTVIIPVRDDAASLARCLQSVRANTDGPSFEIVVADNGSVDSSAEVARAAGARLIRVPGRRVADVRNAAAAVSRGSVLVFIDADHAIDAQWLKYAAETLDETGAAAVGAPYCCPPSSTWVQRTYDLFRERRDRVTDVEWLGSGNLAVRRNVFLSVDGFDGRLEVCEDVDLCNRLRRAGHRLVSDPRLRSCHFGDPATLRSLFAGELWRGRDNVRVSLRGPMTFRALPGILWPIADLILMSAALVGAAFARSGGLRVAFAAVLGIVLLSLVRALRMACNARRPWAMPGSLAVAGVYDLARACALVVRVTHGTRRGRR